MRGVQKVTGFRGINAGDNAKLISFLTGLMREFQHLPKKMLEEMPVIRQMAEHRVENLRLINQLDQLEGLPLKIAHSAFREGFFAGVERVRLIRKAELDKIKNIIKQ